MVLVLIDLTKIKEFYLCLGEAYSRIDNSNLEEIVITNTIPRKHLSNKVKEISVADLFASTISSALSNKSISDNFIC